MSQKTESPSFTFYWCHMTQLRRLFIPVFLTLLAAVPATAADLDEIIGSGPEADRMAVLQTLKIYLTVTDKQEYSAIRESFHPVAYLMSVSDKGALRSLTQDFWWERVSKIAANTPARESTVVIIDVSGHAAIARIDIKNVSSGNTSTDYLNLQKVAAGWRIVNKTLSNPIRG